MARYRFPFVSLRTAPFELSRVVNVSRRHAFATLTTRHLLHSGKTSRIVDFRKFLPIHLAPTGNMNAALPRLLSNKRFHAAVFYVVGNDNKLNSMNTTQPCFSQIVGSSFGKNGGVAVKVPHASIMLFAVIFKGQSELGTVAIQLTAFVTTRC